MMKKKYIFIGLFAFFLLFIIFSYLVIINRRVQEDRLLNDIEKFAEQDIFNDMAFSSSTVSFKYKEVEEVIEDYINDFYKQYQKVMSYAGDQRLTTLLSVTNYLADGKEFNSSLEYVEEVRARFQKDIDKLFQFCTKEGLVRFSKDTSLSDYYQDVFVSSVLDSSLFIKLKNYKVSFLESENQMNKIFNTVTRTLGFLKTNANNWKIENNEIQFSTEDLVNQYNSFVADI